METEPTKYSSGTETERPNTRRCLHCRKWVTKTECALPPDAHYEFAAITCSLLCYFEKEGGERG